MIIDKNRDIGTIASTPKNENQKLQVKKQKSESGCSC